MGVLSWKWFGIKNITVCWCLGRDALEGVWFLGVNDASDLQAWMCPFRGSQLQTSPTLSSSSVHPWPAIPVPASLGMRAQTKLPGDCSAVFPSMGRDVQFSSSASLGYVVWWLLFYIKSKGVPIRISGADLGSFEVVSTVHRSLGLWSCLRLINMRLGWSERPVTLTLYANKPYRTESYH